MQSPIDPSDAARSDIEAGVLQRATIAFICGGCPRRVDYAGWDRRAVGAGLALACRGATCGGWWSSTAPTRTATAATPDPVPVEYQDDQLLRVADGVGPMLHRRYRVRADGGAACAR